MKRPLTLTRVHRRAWLPRYGSACLVHLLALSFALAGPLTAAAASTSVAAEALSRLKGMDLEANPALKTAVLRVVETTRGTAQFVELVRDFKLPGQEPALLDYALQHPSESSATEAIRMVLNLPQPTLIQEALKGARIAETVQLLGSANDRRALPLLEELVLSPKASAAIRDKAVQALARSREGASLLLRHAGENHLPSELKATASEELSRAPWPEIQEQSAKLLRPAGNPADALPPLAELLRRRGDPKNGERVFFAPQANCGGCHQVKARGIDYGPRLTEIGVKLGKDALYAALLDPNAGISFGYETWQLETKDGEEATGLIASETEQEIALKMPGGIVTRYPKSNLAKREKLKTSTMPQGLALTLKPKELVDLVEYLAGLGKPAL